MVKKTGMRIFLILLLSLLSPLSATYLFIFDEQQLDCDQKARLFELILKGEPPRQFHDSDPIDLETECHKLVPSLRLEWIPPSLWQLGVLHAFFHDPIIRNGILACCKHEWEPLGYEQSLHRHPMTARKPGSLGPGGSAAPLFCFFV